MAFRPLNASQQYRRLQPRVFRVRQLAISAKQKPTRRTYRIFAIRRASGGGSTVCSSPRAIASEIQLNQRRYFGSHWEA